MSSRSSVRAGKVSRTTSRPGASYQCPSLALAWHGSERSSLGMRWCRVPTGGGAGLALQDTSQGTPAPLSIHFPSPQRQRALAPPLSCRPPPPRSATRGLWWAAGPWQCVGQLDWSWLPMVSSLFSEYLPNQGRERWDVGARRGQGYGDPGGSSVFGKRILQSGCG